MIQLSAWVAGRTSSSDGLTMDQRFILFLFCGWMIASVSPSHLSAAEGSPRQFLFVVDTSFSMAPEKETLRNAAYEVVYSGVEGEMRAGDKFSFWTFNENPNPEQFPLADWSPEQRQALAGQAYAFLQHQPFQKISRFVNTLNEILRSSQDMK